MTYADAVAATREEQAAEEWSSGIDTAMAALSLEALHGGPKLRGTCAVCGTPVTEEDDPVAVEYGDGQAGVLHGSYDCLDQPRCSVVGMVGDEVPVESRCVLVETHPRDHLIV